MVSECKWRKQEGPAAPKCIWRQHQWSCSEAGRILVLQLSGSSCPKWVGSERIESYTHHSELSHECRWNYFGGVDSTSVWSYSCADRSNRHQYSQSEIHSV